MLLVFLNVQKRCNRSHVIQMTSLYFGSFSWARNEHFSRKSACKPFWPRDLPLVELCIKLWSVRGGGTIRVSKFNIVSSVWASNSRLQRHLNVPIMARKVNPRVQTSMNSSLKVFYKESVHIRDVANKIDPSVENRVIKPTKMARNGRFSRKHTCKPFLARKPTLGAVMH
jgi:hypothetical protein